MQIIYPGKYHHVGVKYNLDCILSNLENHEIPNILELDGNFDGVPIFSDSIEGSFPR